MSLLRKFAVAAGVALASNGALANEATENAMLCMSMADTPNWFALPKGKEVEACTCVGNHSAMMKRSDPSFEISDIMKKGYHACLSGDSISSYYSNFAYQVALPSAGESAARSYASCMSTAGLSQGIRFATDSRTSSQMLDAAGKQCQFILNVNNFMRLFE